MRSKSLNIILIFTIFTLFVPNSIKTSQKKIERDKYERLVKSIYQRQLESILYSVNQHCWDEISYWQAQMTGFAASNVENIVQLHEVPVIGGIVREQSALIAAFLRISDDYFVIAVDDSARPAIPNRIAVSRLVNQTMIDSAQILNRRVQLAKEYVKPLARQWYYNSTYYTLLIFPIINPSFDQGVIFGGLLIDDVQFILDIVARRFSSIAQGEFVFAVRRRNEDDLLYYTPDDHPDEPFELGRELWVLPQYELKIKMAGVTLNHLAKKRSQRNLATLAFIMVIFLIGGGFVLCNLKKEIAISRIKTNLVANVSHEIRTPVALIRMYAEMLEYGQINDEVKKKKYYKTILAETVRLSQLINNMLDFSKIESGKKEYHLRPGDVSDVLSQVLDMYQPSFEQQGFRIRLDMEPDLPPVNMDNDAVTQAIVNLLDNAMKYSTDKKIIEIILKHRNEQVLLSVTDHGIGIPPTEHKRIFQKFYRVGDSLVHNTKGSGLGLSLVEHIMEIHKGHVELTSEVGEGSTFTLIFPKHQGA